MPPLTEAKLRALKAEPKMYRVTDAAGLYIEVVPAGGRYWRLKYRVDGREKRLALGVYPAVSLAQARAARDEARAQLRQGIDPGAAKRAARLARGDTVEAIAREWLERERTAGRGRARRGLADTTAEATRARLELHVLPRIGRRPLASVTPADILEHVLQPLEQAGKVDTAHRVKWILGRVYRYAIQTRRADADPTSALRGALSPLVAESRAALTDPRQVGEMLRAIDGYHGTATVRTGLQLSALLLVRPGELRAMRWTEIDAGAALWRIPAERTKMRREHLVPLSRQALALIEGRRGAPHTGEYVMPAEGRRGLRPMSEAGVNVGLRALGYAGMMTAHGFRATASTLLHELGWDTMVIEAQLGHEDADRVRGVYNRAKYLPQRREMMQAWADYVDGLRADRGV